MTRPSDNEAVTLTDFLARIDQALWPHFDKKISTWSSHHTANQHESESADCDPELCFESITICNGCGTKGCTEPLADLMREVRPILAARLAGAGAQVTEARVRGLTVQYETCRGNLERASQTIAAVRALADSRAVGDEGFIFVKELRKALGDQYVDVSTDPLEAAVEAAAVEIKRLIEGWMNYDDEDWPMLARAALSAALPHMGTGQAEASRLKQIVELQDQNTELRKAQARHAAQMQAKDKQLADLRARISALAETWRRCDCWDDCHCQDLHTELSHLLDRPAAEGDNE